MKACTKCKEEKPFVEFNKNKGLPDGLYYVCKSCVHAYNNSEKRRKKRNLYSATYWKTPARLAYVREWNLKNKYGISTSDYEQMLVDQNGSCAICDKSHRECENGLYVDHDHSTNKTRQLLCRDCNVGIGHFKENPDLLQKAIDYLERHQSSKKVINLHQVGGI